MGTATCGGRGFQERARGSGERPMGAAADSTTSGPHANPLPLSRTAHGSHAPRLPSGGWCVSGCVCILDAFPSQTPWLSPQPPGGCPLHLRPGTGAGARSRRGLSPDGSVAGPANASAIPLCVLWALGFTLGMREGLPGPSDADPPSSSIRPPYPLYAPSPLFLEYPPARLPPPPHPPPRPATPPPTAPSATFSLEGGGSASQTEEPPLPHPRCAPLHMYVPVDLLFDMQCWRDCHWPRGSLIGLEEASLA